MKIARLEITNFRSIEHIDLFPPSLCVLIGENNAGKSNILRALSLVLGDAWPSERHFSDDDFYNHTADPISIKVYFDSTFVEFRNGVNLEVAGFELSCKAYKRRVGTKPAGTLKVDYVCVDKTGKTLTYPSSPLRRGERNEGPWLDFRVTSELRERVPLIYIDVLRQYEDHDATARWSTLRRMLAEVNKEFAADKKKINVVQPDGTTQALTRREAFEQTVRQAYQYLRTESFNQIETKLAAHALEHMGLTEGSVSLSFQSHDPTNAYKSLELFVTQMGMSVPATDVGAGLQSAIVIAIFRTYEELKKEGAIFALEEPEVFLHPQKARFFRSILTALSAQGNQVIISTHSPIFVDISKPENVCLVRRTEADGTQIVQPKRTDLAANERAQLRLLTEFDTQRNELFFARRVLLVEGATEKLAFPLIAAAMKKDINRLGISVIECGGKANLPLFVRVAKAMSLTHVVVADDDIVETDPSWDAGKTARAMEHNKQHRAMNKRLEDVALPGTLFFLKPNFEGVAGLPRNPDTKLDRAIEKFNGIASTDVPIDLLAPLIALVGEDGHAPAKVA